MLVDPLCCICSIWKQETWNRHTHKVSTVTLVRMRRALTTALSGITTVLYFTSLWMQLDHEVYTTQVNWLSFAPMHSDCGHSLLSYHYWNVQRELKWSVPKHAKSQVYSVKLCTTITELVVSWRPSTWVQIKGKLWSSISYSTTLICWHFFTWALQVLVKVLYMYMYTSRPLVATTVVADMAHPKV